MNVLEESGPTGSAIGRVVEESPDAHERYPKHLQEVCLTDLTGLHVVVDCANGAASKIAPKPMRRQVLALMRSITLPMPNNINDDCGSTHIEKVQAAVREYGADSLCRIDGDADRCLAVDAEGNVVDGDQIMGILAVGMKTILICALNTLVATAMSNLGPSLAMPEQDIEMIQTKVATVTSEALYDGGFSLGGEQSGHIVLPDTPQVMAR